MIGILLVTHSEIGKSFIDCASHILGKSINLLECIPVDPKSDLHECQKFIDIEITNLDVGSGVLIITDIYGATPSNILKQYTDQSNIEDGSLSQLVNICMKSAKDGIIKMNSK